MQALLRSSKPGGTVIALVISLCAAPDARPGDENSGIIRGTDAETGLLSWRWEQAPLSLELVQRLPDQTRAFFEGRGFAADGADAIAVQCVFQTILRNTAAHPEAGLLEVDLSEWRVRTPSGEQSLKLRDDWNQEWRRRSVPESARIAFRWSLFPTLQRFQPGDYNWGMTIYGLPPGASFDLHVVWYVRGSRQSGILRDLRCALDSDSEAGRKG